MIKLLEIEQPASGEPLSFENKFGALYLCLASMVLVPLVKTGVIAYFCRAITGRILNDDIFYLGENKTGREISVHISDVMHMSPQLRGWGIFFGVLLIILAAITVGFGIYAAYLMLKTNEPRAFQMAKRALNIDLLCSVLMAIISAYSIIHLGKIADLSKLAFFRIETEVVDIAFFTVLILLIISIINTLVWRLYLRLSRRLPSITNINMVIS